MNKKPKVMEIFWFLAALKRIKQIDFLIVEIFCFLHRIDKSVHNVSLSVDAGLYG